MYARILGNVKFWNGLLEIDEELSKKSLEKPCRFCGGPVYVANYERKPRDVPEGVDERFCLRFSGCCGTCRRRCTPSSLRFLGRRVYVGAVVAVGVMYAYLTTAAWITQKRWRRWWSCELLETDYWRAFRAYLSPTIDARHLPESLVEQIQSEDSSDNGPAKSLAKLLSMMAPLTTGSYANGEGVDLGEVFAQTTIVEGKMKVC